MSCLAVEDKPLLEPDLYTSVTAYVLVLYHWVTGCNPVYLIACNFISG
jgi:hypothetical protein